MRVPAICGYQQMFVYGVPTTNPFGREREIGILSNFLRSGQPVGLMGVRRVGKTSLLLASLRQSSLPYIYLSAEEFTSGKSFDFHSFISGYVVSVTSTLYSLAGYRVLTDKGRSWLRQLRDLVGAIKVTFNIPEVSATLDVTLEKVERRKRLEEELPRIVDLPQIMAERFGVPRVVIAIDEFQYLNLAKQSIPNVFHVLRSRWQFHTRVSYVISGSLIGMMNELLSSRDQPFYQFFYLMKVGPLPPDVSRDFLRRGFEHYGVRVGEEEIDRVVDYVDGLPAWLNLVGLKVVSEGKSVNQVLDTLTQDINVVNAIEGDLRKLSPGARSVLKRLAMLGGQGRPRDLGDDRWGVVRALQQLIRYGIVEREDEGNYRIVDPLLVHYLRGN
ncbi:MAG: ATP-binding protein [Metallosphaera prunae]|uniref:AAA family ATPase n=1 Tax=Metallosphaera prunae TaxID=47304 RepID=UPI002272D9DC|nr:ATP-binding protein [Metallosphaera prunae]MCY0860923.1 ATP-binding protein [Metallosphaera prunae]